METILEQYRQNHLNSEIDKPLDLEAFKGNQKPADSLTRGIEATIFINYALWRSDRKMLINP